MNLLGLWSVAVAALLEQGLAASQPQSRDDVARTSGFLPWFPESR